ncbi:MAG: flagellar brake protein [Acidobacteriota bacterium]
MSAPDLSHFHCPPGTRLALEVTGLPDKFATACVGHARGRFLVTAVPALAETVRVSFYQLLYPDNTVIVRYLHEGTVVGFTAQIIKCIQIPFPLIFLTFPKKIESHDLRRHTRVACCLPGQAVIAGADVPGMVLDLSNSGCLFSATVTDTPPAVAIDDVVNLHCDLFGPNGSSGLGGIVKRVALSGRRLELGLKFRDISPPIQQAINDYLDQALSILG